MVYHPVLVGTPPLFINFFVLLPDSCICFRFPYNIAIFGGICKLHFIKPTPISLYTFRILAHKYCIMASIIIQSDNADNVELIAKLAKKLGGHVSNVTDEQSEDIALGNIMQASKTGENVSRDEIMKKLRGK